MAWLFGFIVICGAYSTMIQLNSKQALSGLVAQWKTSGKTIGVVMTMGALHEGHLALVEAARKDNDHVVATIFVNPKQFDRAEDLQNYPVDTASDLEKLQAAGVDAVYLPTPEDIYPQGYATKIVATAMQDCLCGATRPGHMDGVTTVVSKLLVRTGADHAYFGQKDYQQFKLVERVAADLDLPVAIVGIPTVREADGLALSSRNRRLDREQRAQAVAIPEALKSAAAALHSGKSWDEVRAEAEGKILDAGFSKLDYLDLRRESDLSEVLELKEGEAVRLFVAGFIGTVRLIDNLPV
ncbi:pantoate--beta-alanine ligase [Kiloniella sp. b19]|uniref:pantoate--beta-alanine ligase n=1 Tax=Kiloniella sp. GXU_MW_B19 TaxID=3141326 RepID=UPI0031DF76C3